MVLDIFLTVVAGKPFIIIKGAGLSLSIAAIVVSIDFMDIITHAHGSITPPSRSRDMTLIFSVMGGWENLYIYRYIYEIYGGFYFNFFFFLVFLFE